MAMPMMNRYRANRAARDRSRIRRYVLAFSIALTVIAVVQTSVFARLRIFSAVPDLLFAATLAAAFFCGRETGAIVGIAAGFLSDALGGAPGYRILPVAFFLVGYLAGHFSRVFAERSFVPYMTVVAVALPVHAFITVIQLFLNYGNVRMRSSFTGLFLPEAGALIVAALLIWFPLRAMCRKLETDR